MADFTIKFNTVQLLGAAEEAFKSVNEAAGVQFTRRITENRWEWPREPSPRDIVDLGQLRDSYKGPRMIEPTLAEHAWPVDYAMAVHEGANIKNAWGRGIRVTLPARPWVTTTLKEWDFAAAYGKLARVLMQKRAPPE